MEDQRARRNTNALNRGGNSGFRMRSNTSAGNEGIGLAQPDLVPQVDRDLEVASRRVEELEQLDRVQKNLGSNTQDRGLRGQYQAANAQTVAKLEQARQAEAKAAADSFVYHQGDDARQNQARYGTRGMAGGGGSVGPMANAGIVVQEHSNMNPLGPGRMVPGHRGMGNDPYALTGGLTTPIQATSTTNLTPQPFVGGTFGGGADDGQYLPRGMGGAGGMGGIGGVLSGDGGCCKRLTDILSQIRACVCGNEKPDGATTEDGDKPENPHTEMLDKLKTSFDALLLKLQEVVDSLSPEEGEKPGDANVPTLTINPDSITGLSDAIKEAVKEKFDELIQALNDNNQGGGDASTVDGNINLNHSPLQVSGMVDVKMPEDLRNIEQVIQDAINKKLLQIGIDPGVVSENALPATGGPMAPGLPPNTA